MHLSGNDFSRLYQLQDKFLRWWAEQGYPFYLTGGTALGRFYFNHRYSEDLDFFVNNDASYSVYIKDLMKKIMVSFEVDLKQSLFTGDFTRIFIRENDIQLKIDLVNEIKYYAGSVVKYRYGYIDTPLNILSNKLVAITGRDEPKDVFDICKISENYSFNWQEIFYHAKQKAIINEIDVEERLITFPLHWIQQVTWLREKPDTEAFRKAIKQIADDFLLGKENSLGKDRLPIEKATPVM